MLRVVLLAALLLAPGGAAAIMAETVPFMLDTKLWLLNGDPIKYPLVPQVQELAVPRIEGTDTIIVTPTLAIPDDLGGSHALTVFETKQGQGMLVPNPTNPSDPFTPPFLSLQIENDAGLFEPTPSSGFGGSLPLDLRIYWPMVEAGAGYFFVLDLPPSGSLRFGTLGASQTFEALVTLLSIPVTGTARGDRWTTGRVSVAKRCDLRPPRTCPVPDFTATSTGSRKTGRLSLVTPFVIDAFWGVGPNRVPFPMLGFFRLTLHVVPEPGATALLLCAAGLLGIAWRMR